MNYGLWIKILKDIFFPIFCFGCQKEGEWLCDNCANNLAVKPNCSCPFCKTQNLSGEVCFDCQQTKQLDQLSCFFNYRENKEAAALVRAFKYSYALETKEIWEKIIDRFLRQTLNNSEKFYREASLIAVPLHPRRQRERGFNQSKILAEIFQKILKNQGNYLELTQGLARKKYTKQQAGLDLEKRKENLKDAFVWEGKQKPPKKVLLVDDVFTGGATMNECAKVLKNAGSVEVRGMVLALGG